MNPSQPDLDDLVARSRAALREVRLTPSVQNFGRVERVADGVAFVSGLPDVRLNELLAFEGGRRGFAMTLAENEIAAVLLDDPSAITAGGQVSTTGDVIRTPVGEALLGRVIDPLGRPLDGGGPIAATDFWPVERDAPAIIDRALVSDMLATGVLVVDSLFTVGRGQRELIIGDRATGKTSLAVDAMVNQKHSDVICVYVGIGQRASSIERVIESVRAFGDPARTIFVIAPASASAGLQWIAPFAGFSIAEYFRDRCGHALVVLDDLSKHAATHREIALLTREPPGREAYPGDVFYLHARMLERAARLSPERGGGSLTALPIAETDAGNLSSYIPTNLISITDGQIVLDARLFAANRRPAVNVGLSVSRVGGKAQDASLRQASGRVRLDYAQFVELETFARLGGVTEAGAKARLARGERLRALFGQPRFCMLRPIDQVSLLLAVAEGCFDALTDDEIAALRARLPQEIDAHAADLVAGWREKKPLDEAARARLVALARDLATKP